MRTTAFLKVAVITGLTALAAACATEDSVSEGDDEVVGTKNLTSNDFGLKDKEVVLTLDDGPGPRTIEIAEFLAKEKVPAVFFMVGKNAKANPEAVKRVAELSKESGGTILVANHSMTHTDPLPKQGVSGSIDEIMSADKILASNIQLSQEGLPSATAFFRPPYGAFTSLGAANISRVNAGGASKYVGPVFWDIGGELSERFSADWACWGKKNGVSVARCTDGYIAETKARKRGIILVHDVHSKTIDMLTGGGTANGRSLIKELRAAGFKFVSLREHEPALEAFRAEQERLANATEISIEASVKTTTESGRVVVDVKTQNAAKVVAQFDNGETNGIEFTGNKELDVTLAPGSHFVTITAFNAAGVAQAQKRFTFVIAAPIEPGSPEASSDAAVCVNFDLMKAGQLFRLYHGKVACDATLANGSKPHNPPFIDECYQFKGVLKATRDPKLVGPSEWSLDFDLSYQADPNDKSKVGMVVEAGDGSIVTGKRFARGAGRADVPMTIESADCAHGEFRGTFHYDNGKTEDFLFRMVKNPQTGGKIDYRE